MTSIAQRLESNQAKGRRRELEIANEQGFPLLLRPPPFGKQ